MATYQTQKFTDAVEGLTWAWETNALEWVFTPYPGSAKKMIGSCTSEELDNFVSQSKQLFTYWNTLFAASQGTNLATIQANMDAFCSIFRSFIPGLQVQVTSIGFTLVRVEFTLLNDNLDIMVGDFTVESSGPISRESSEKVIYVPIIQGYPIPFNITVKFNADGGSPTPANQTIAWQYDDFDIGSEIAAVSTPSLTNHLFQGWYYNGLLVSTDGQTFSGIPSSQFSINDITITLNASWLAAIAKGGYIIV